MQKFYIVLRSMPNGSEHSRIMGDMTRRQALVKYGQGLRYIAVHQAKGNQSTVQLYEDGILLRSDIVQGWYIMQDKEAKWNKNWHTKNKLAHYPLTLQFTTDKL